jgi:hypothetical protein
MSSHTEWGHAAHALYTLHPRDRVGEELQPADLDAVSEPYVLGIWTQNGDGVALEGDRRQLLDFAALLGAFIDRETSALPELTRALAQLHELHRRRSAALDAIDLAAVSDLDEEEVLLLQNVARAAEALHNQL